MNHALLLLREVGIGFVLMGVLGLATYLAVEGGRWADRKLKARRNDR